MSDLCILFFIFNLFFFSEDETKEQVHRKKNDKKREKSISELKDMIRFTRQREAFNARL